MKRKRKVEQRLDDLYESIPVSIECKGLCQGSCGPIAMTEAEFRRISEASESIPTVDGHGTCSLLVGGKCSVYEIRPLVCRLFGIVEKMTCPYGCKPNPRFLSNVEQLLIHKRIDKITGHKEMKETLPGLVSLISKLRR